MLIVLDSVMVMLCICCHHNIASYISYTLNCSVVCDVTGTMFNMCNVHDRVMYYFIQTFFNNKNTIGITYIIAT